MKNLKEYTKLHISQPMLIEIQCKKCDFKAMTRSRFKEHNDLHDKLEETTQPFECGECDWTGTPEEYRNIHADACNA